MNFHAMYHILLMIKVCNKTLLKTFHITMSLQILLASQNRGQIMCSRYINILYKGRILTSLFGAILRA